MAGPQEQKPYEIFKPAGETKEQRNPVIFLHAMLCSKEIWGQQILQRVADETGRMVYTYDARCHGENKGIEEFSFEDLVEDLYKFMTEVNIEKAILVGHSMGGKTAISVALNKPEKVEKVFIVDMYVKAIPDELIERSIKFMKYWRNAVKDLSDTPVSDVTSKSVPKLYEKLEHEQQMDKEQKESEMKAYLKSTFRYATTEDGKHDVYYNTDALAKALENYKGQKKEEPSGKFTGPAFFLYGTKSPYQVGKEEEAIKTYFPKAEMIPFTDAPHHIFVHDPDLFISTLVEKINVPLS